MFKLCLVYAYILKIQHLDAHKGYTYKECIIIIIIVFLSAYMAGPRSRLGHYRGSSLTDLMLITAFQRFSSVIHRAP